MDDKREQRSPFPVLFLLALAGVVVLAWAMPRYDAGTRWDYKLDRSQAIARAHAEAARLGLDTRNWLPRLNATANPTTEYYLTLQPRRAETSLLSPVTTTVMLVEPAQQKQSYSVDLNAGGQVLAYEIRDAAATPSPSPTPGAQETKESVPAEASRRAAQGALEGLVGVEAAKEFALVSEVGVAQGVRFTWERAIPQEDRLKLRVESLVRGESVRRIELSSSFAPRFVDESRNRLSAYKLTELLSVLYAILLGLGTLAFCLLAWARRELNFLSTFVLLGVVYLPGVVWQFYGSFDQQLMNRNAEGSNPLSLLGVALNLLALPFFYALAIALVWGAGRIYARRTQTPQIATFEALLRGRLTSRPVGRAIAAGILLGLFLCAIPYLVAASGIFGALKLEGPLLSSIVSGAPAIIALIRPIDYGLYGLYAFLLPLVVFYARAPRIARVVGLLIGGIWILNETIYRSSAWAAWVTAALVIIALDQIIRRFDLLTLLVALHASDAIRVSWSLVVQPSPVLRGSGYRALAGVGLMLVGALVLSWKGRAAAEATEETESSQALAAAERDRLRAEFTVAHEAQQRMLPSNPPRVTGYEISAMCRPAREVGGDLFDLLTLPNERIGFVVADVSGKGVPAALY
ncbi:MAG TPA: hypothetical protein VNA19_16585, partial [Pyrinomonadaceae bacterium]|nr:hypothetical protein [Pyrinomonadaceae bacterium]